MFGQALNPIIRSDGSPKASTLAGALANVILDPVFIFVFRWGMMGAAVATVLGQILTAALAVWYLYHMKAVRLEGQSFRIHGKLAGKYLPLGICSFLSQISLVMAMAAIQNMTLKYSAIDPIFGQIQYTQIPMAVLGIVMKFFQIVISISVGLAAGCIPVVGYNIGAGRRDRAKSLFIRLLAAEAIVGAAALLIVALYSECRVGEHMSYEDARKFVAPILADYGAEEYFSPEEKNYLDNPDSTEKEQIQFAWQYENLWVMEWALGLTDDLFWPDRICDVPASARLMQNHPTMEALLAAAKLRPRKELLDQADLIYRLHWACVDARVMGMPAPQELEEGVVMERHRALFWLAGCDEMCGWDDVDLST